MLRIADIIRATAAAAGLEPKAIIGRVRPGPGRLRLVEVQQRAMYLARRLRPDASLHQIARVFGRHDHTCVIHNSRAVAHRLADLPTERVAVEALMHALAPRADLHRYREQLLEEIGQAEKRLQNLRLSYARVSRLDEVIRDHRIAYVEGPSCAA